MSGNVSLGLWKVETVCKWGWRKGEKEEWPLVVSMECGSWVFTILQIEPERKIFNSYDFLQGSIHWTDYSSENESPWICVWKTRVQSEVSQVKCSGIRVRCYTWWDVSSSPIPTSYILYEWRPLEKFQVEDDLFPVVPPTSRRRNISDPRYTLFTLDPSSTWHRLTIVRKEVGYSLRGKISTYSGRGVTVGWSRPFT